uniref:Uncharacterized protein n=1 Tax=Caudovirales sp. ctaix4 TaxID=2827635 RepID=A0A8S5S5K8_9CAUD|nr:MAG TPA: hypothetical protein [Caudovirales sp. ctaix4]
MAKRQREPTRATLCRVAERQTRCDESGHIFG